MRRVLLASGEAVVGKSSVGTDEDVILDGDPVPKLHPAFNRGPIADHYVVFYETVVANVAIGADSRAWENVSERPYPRPFPDFLAFYQRLAVLVIRHLVDRR